MKHIETTSCILNLPLLLIDGNCVRTRLTILGTRLASVIIFWSLFTQMVFVNTSSFALLISNFSSQYHYWLADHFLKTNKDNSWLVRSSWLLEDAAKFFDARYFCSKILREWLIVGLISPITISVPPKNSKQERFRFLKESDNTKSVKDHCQTK